MSSNSFQDIHIKREIMLFILFSICSAPVQINPDAAARPGPGPGGSNTSSIAFRPVLFLLTRKMGPGIMCPGKSTPVRLLSGRNRALPRHRTSPLPGNRAQKNSVPNRSHPAAELSSIVFVSLSHSRHPKTVRLTCANAFGMSFITRMH